jgi:hypothetical protein
VSTQAVSGRPVGAARVAIDAVSGRAAGGVAGAIGKGDQGSATGGTKSGTGAGATTRAGASQGAHVDGKRNHLTKAEKAPDAGSAALAVKPCKAGTTFRTDTSSCVRL